MSNFKKNDRVFVRSPARPTGTITGTLSKSSKTFVIVTFDNKILNDDFFKGMPIDVSELRHLNGVNLMMEVLEN